MTPTQAAMIAADAENLAAKAAAAAESEKISDDVRESLRRSFLTLKASAKCLANSKK